MGKLIALEGVDGSGKGTQTAALAQSLKDAGATVKVYSFPRYTDNCFGSLVGEFLAGKHGAIKDQSPYLMALLFAGDRALARQEMLMNLQVFDYVLCDRYVSSNIAHQAAHVPPEGRESLRDWIEYVEYVCNALPVPAMQIYLDVPLATARVLIAKKAKRVYTDKAADEHEADGVYLQSVIDVYEQMCTHSRLTHGVSARWSRVVCVNPLTGELASVEAVADEVLARALHVH
jgi:dTMP kinase